MTTITIPDLDDELTQKLEQRAARRQHSVEDQVREIILQALSGKAARPDNLADRTGAIVEPFGGCELELSPREPVREPPDFS